MLTSNKPDIETSGLAALFYDQLVCAGTLGLYQRLLKRVIAGMNIQPEDDILDMGAGTGKNALLMNRYLDKGSIIALEIGRQMQKQLRRRCGRFGNINIESLRIERPLPYRDRFNKVMISYVLHGFESHDRQNILQNAYRALTPGGELFIFDWNEFNLKESGPIMRFFMNRIECHPVLEFIRHDLRKELKATGFHTIRTTPYFHDRIRLLRGMK